MADHQLQRLVEDLRLFLLTPRQHPVWYALLHWQAILMGRQIEGQDLATG